MRVFALLVLFLGAGTAAAKNYREPEGPSAAIRVLLANPEAYSVHIAEYDPTACRKSADVGWVSGGRKIDAVRAGMPNAEAPREGILERRIPIGRAFAFGTGFIMPKQSIARSLMGAANPGGSSAQALADAQAAICEAPVFVPDPGSFYELHIALLPQRCDVALFRLEPDGDDRWRRTAIATDAIRFPEAPGKPVCPVPGK